MVASGPLNACSGPVPDSSRTGRGSRGAGVGTCASTAEGRRLSWGVRGGKGSPSLLSHGWGRKSGEGGALSLSAPRPPSALRPPSPTPPSPSALPHPREVITGTTSRIPGVHVPETMVSLLKPQGVSTRKEPQERLSCAWDGHGGVGASDPVAGEVGDGGRNGGQGR